MFSNFLRWVCVILLFLRLKGANTAFTLSFNETCQHNQIFYQVLLYFHSPRDTEPHRQPRCLVGKGNMDQAEEGGSYTQQLCPQALSQKQGVQLPSVLPPHCFMDTLCTHGIHKHWAQLYLLASFTPLSHHITSNAGFASQCFSYGTTWRKVSSRTLPPMWEKGQRILDYMQDSHHIRHDYDLAIVSIWRLSVV